MQSTPLSPDKTVTRTIFLVFYILAGIYLVLLLQRFGWSNLPDFFKFVNAAFVLTNGLRIAVNLGRASSRFVEILMTLCAVVTIGLLGIAFWQLLALPS
jgi:Na+/glutamate symporter